MFTRASSGNIGAVYVNGPSRDIQLPRSLSDQDAQITINAKSKHGTRFAGGFDVRYLRSKDNQQPQPKYTDQRRTLRIQICNLRYPVVRLSLSELVQEGFWKLPEFDAPEDHILKPRVVVVDELTDNLTECVPEHAQPYRQAYGTLGLLARKALLG